MTTTTESTAATIADNPIKEPVSEDKAGLEEVEEGELPEEGEITDDDEVESAKNQAENKPQQGAPTTQQSQKQQHNERRSEYHSNKGGGRDGGVTWRKSFSGHHQQQFGRNNKFTPNRGGGNDGRYRDFDGRVAMKTDAQREEEMFDSWDRGVSRKNRAAHSHSSPKRGDISPIRTTPMIESAAAQGTKTEQVTQESPRKSEPVKQEAEMTAAAAAPLDDDMDFRGANVNQQIEQKEANVPADDVDFRRSSASSNFPAGPPIAPPQLPFGNHSPPPFGTGPPHHFDGGNRRRPHSQSPPPRFRDDQQQIHPEFYEGSAAKRIRPFFHPDDEQRESSTPSGPGESDEGFGGGGFMPGGPFEGGPRQFQQHGEGGWSQGRGGFQNFNQRGRGGGTMGWGYRGGRPFFPRLICKFFREGFCRDAEKCTFSHATADSHRQPQLCKYYQAGFCKKALFCQLMHGEWPCKAFHKGECTKEPCMFSHEPLDDVSRPIVEKMMEDERLGINTEQSPQQGTPHQFHNNFRGGHQQQQPGGGFYRPRFYYQQGQGQPGIQQQHRFQHPQQHQSPHPPFPPHQQQPHPAGGMPANFPPPPPPNTGEHQQLQPPPPHFGQSAQQFMPEGGQQPPPQSSSFSPEFQQQHGIGTVPPPIPPPGLVLPPMLSGTPNSTTAQAHQNPFGYFNPAGSVQQPPHPPHMHPPPTSGISIPPQPSFQQLQQQVQQQGITPHFPHQPSLLGPTANVPTGISQMPPNIQQQMMMESPIKQQQEFSGQSAAHMHESSLAFQQPTSSTDEQKKDVEKSPSDGGGGFNINQMLEQITREQSPPSSSPGTKKIVNFADPTMDLISSIGFGPGGMGLSGLLADDESPASPAVETEQIHGDNPAAMIPVTCEWKLHIVDIPSPTDPNLHFDMKFIQQISSSNSDPRLRRLAEKQFDLVSKTLEKQQQQMASTSQQQQKEGDGDSSIVSELLNRVEEPGAEGANVVADPRKDPRRKTKGGMEKTGKGDGSNSDQIAAKSSQSSPAHFNIKSEPIAEEQQQTIGANTTNRNSPPSTSTLTTACSIDEEMVQKQMAALMNAALGYGPSLMGIKPPQNFSTPPPGMLQSHQISQMPPQSMPMAPHLGQQKFYTTPPPFVQHHPQASSSTFLRPNQPPTAQTNPPQLFHGAGAMAAQITPQPRLPNQQMLGAHAFNLGGTGQFNLSGATQVAASPPQSSMTGGGNNYHRGRRNGGTGGGGRHQVHHQQPDSPKQHQQSSPQQQNTGSQSPQQKLPPAAPPTMSLREKRKNNEYESPLARLASSGHRQ